MTHYQATHVSYHVILKIVSLTYLTNFLYYSCVGLNSENKKYNRDLWRKQNTDNVKYCRSGLIGPVHEWQWIVECCHSRHLAPG